MTRPTPHSAFPYTRSAVCSMVGVGVPTLKNFVRGIRALRRRPRGTGNWNGFDFDDALRVALAKELLRVGLQVSSISSLFDSIEKTTPVNLGWTYLRTSRARTEGATLVLILGHPLGPDTAHGHVYLTTAAEAKRWLESKRTVIVIDINEMIRHLEEVTGERYEISPRHRMGRSTKTGMPPPPAPPPAFEDEVLPAEPRGWPRLLSRKLAALYLSVSDQEIDRLISVGAIGVVRLPAVRHDNGGGRLGANRRILIDRLELDALCAKHREQVGR